MNSMNNGSPIEGRVGHSSESKLEGWLERGGILRALFDDAPQGVIVTRSDGIIQECNLAAARMLGYTPEELTGLRFNEITHPEDVGIGMQQLRALVSGDKSHATFTKRYLRKDGAVVWVRLDVSPIRGVEGPVHFFVTSVDDSPRCATASSACAPSWTPCPASSSSSTARAPSSITSAAARRASTPPPRCSSASASRR
jgi:PAS domain S-box-containing protein